VLQCIGERYSSLDENGRLSILIDILYGTAPMKFNHSPIPYYGC
jgi:hypothetical protein